MVSAKQFENALILFIFHRNPVFVILPTTPSLLILTLLLLLLYYNNSTNICLRTFYLFLYMFDFFLNWNRVLNISRVISYRFSRHQNNIGIHE